MLEQGHRLDEGDQRLTDYCSPVTAHSAIKTPTWLRNGGRWLSGESTDASNSLSDCSARPVTAVAGIGEATGSGALVWSGLRHTDAIAGKLPGEN